MAFMGYFFIPTNVLIRQTLSFVGAENFLPLQRRLSTCGGSALNTRNLVGDDANQAGAP